MKQSGLLYFIPAPITKHNVFNLNIYAEDPICKED
ncbi:Uncharacterised protein [Porphyromonas macacae]|uniref:Uncharacterized protein n=1 Tax=Porphyromonas macacae TaxID=28115 RepID=A0A379E6M1_9PORP|nr:Uncharacterised protein [Porphyromonas macacae]